MPIRYASIATLVSGCLVVLGLTALTACCNPSLAQDGNDPKTPPEPPAGRGQRQGGDPRIGSILDDLKRRAEKQRDQDRRTAHQLLQQALQVESEGKLAEALALLRQAERLAPESPEIREALRLALQRQADRRRASMNHLVASRRIEEALDYIGTLRQRGQNASAQELAEAVRQALDELPDTAELRKVREAAREILGEKPSRPESDSSKPMQEPIENDEDIPPPVRIGPPPDRTQGASSGSRPSQAASSTPAAALPTDADLRRALNQRVSLDWFQLPLSSALRELSEATGVPIVLDPALDQRGLAPLVAVNLRVREAPVERVLRLLGELTGGAYILHQGQVVFTTKANALEFALTGKYGGVTLVAPDPLGRTSVSPAVRRSPMRTEPPPPEYLRSGQAFLEHLRDLLEP